MNPDIAKTLHDLPKVELHRHLEGSIPLPLVLEWSKKYNLPLPKGDTDQEILNGLKVTSPMPLNPVLERLFFQQRCFQNVESIETLTYEVIKDIARDNIKLIELRFSPGFMAEPQNLSFNSVMEAVLSAKEKAQKDFDIEVGYILISSRDMGVDVCAETVDLAIKWKKDIVGIDLAGPEEEFPPDPFEKPFQRAVAAGLHVTAHSGEVSDPKHISTSIDKLGATRIGHGVRAITSPAVIQHLIDRKIPLELCPTSNLMTQGIPNLEAHPLKRLIKAGVLVTISSDDPTLFGTTLTQEYEICHRHMGFTIPEINETILTSFHHSFLPEAQKKRVWNKHFKYLKS